MAQLLPLVITTSLHNKHDGVNKGNSWPISLDFRLEINGYIFYYYQTHDLLWTKHAYIKHDDRTATYIFPRLVC